MKYKYSLKNIERHVIVFIISILVLFTSSGVTAQNSIAVSGTVTSSADGSALPGLSIVVKGTTTGTTTNADGKYTINVPDNGTLLFSFIGFTPQEVAVDGRNTIDITMEPTTIGVDEVVVTALGIKREEKSLGFSVGKVSGEELTRVAQENVLNSMAGKVSGVTINSTGGAGSTVSMVIRGATSMTTDNQPLFVVDGIPMSNTVNNVGGFGSDNRVDYGNGIADLDPESIENVTILKGPSAAALYGTRAGNGVVLITTKKATGKGMKVSVGSNTVFDIPSRFLGIQSQFSTGFFSFRPEDVGGGILPEIDPIQGVGAGPENDKGYWAVQWDAPLDANGVPVPTEVVSYPNNINNFINDYAFTTTNSASISNSNSTTNYRLGFTNMTHSGLVPNSDLNKNALSLSASSKVRDKLTISTDINFANSWADNIPASNRGSNPLQWAFATPTNIDILKLRDYGPENNYRRVSENHENPYYLAYEVNNSFNRYRVYGNVVANWEISSNFNLMGRFTLNKTDEVRESKIGPGYSQEPNNGAYGIVNSNGMERNMDVLGTYKNDFDDFSVSVSAGGNVLYSKASSLSNSSKSGSGLVVPNVYTIQNISSGALNYSNGRSQKGINSVYGMANLSWREIAYLDLTARNDWSSTLPAENRSYFYPSASLSLMIDQIISMGDKVDMLKIRAGWAQVGNDTSPYQLLSTYGDAGQWGDAIRLGKSGTVLSPNLLPEESTSYEIGTDIRMFANRLRFEGTYYSVDNRNQILQVQLPASTGFSSTLINAGLLQSKGWEFLLGVTPVRTQDWKWDVDINFTKNETTLLELSEGLSSIQFWDEAKVRNIGYVKSDDENGPNGIQDGLVGNLYARKINRVKDESSPYYNYPILGSGLDAEWEGEDTYSKVGNYNPDFIMGIQSSLTYKNFNLSMTFDWRSGGQYVSQTSHYFSEDVISQVWLDELVNPGDLGGAPSQALRDWVVAHADQLIYANEPRPIGGPTPEYGGFPESFSGFKVYDGTFAAGVMGHYDDNGKFILEHENLGNEGTIFLPYVVSNPWDIGESKLFDADYVKLREIALSYRLPNKISQKWGLGDVNFSIYSRNIMIWTKDSKLGVDPERAYQAEGNGQFKQGVERYNVEPWVIPVGFKVGFTF